MEYKDTQYDPLFMKYARFYRLPWRLVKSQCWQESRFNPNAVSRVGAKGLMQLMPETAIELGGEGKNLFDPELSVNLGCKYDKIQYDHFPEISKVEEKLKFMLASYNGGRGYINKALSLARKEELGNESLEKASFGMWQSWIFTGRFINDPLCMVGGRKPDSYQILDYVDKIWYVFMLYAFDM